MKWSSSPDKNESSRVHEVYRCEIVAKSGDSSTERGFTLVEMLVTLILFTITIGLTATVFAGYQTRTAARRAAQVFQMDLSLARTSAVRGREAVIVDFDENQGSYLVRSESGDTLVKREFDTDDDIPLDSLNLQLPGDSVVFDSRGVGDLSGAASTLGIASFAAGESVYDVSFNVIGALRLDPR